MLHLNQLSLEYSCGCDPFHLHLHHHEITRDSSFNCSAHAMSRLEHQFSLRITTLGSYLSVEVRIKQHFSASKVNTELTVLRSKEIKYLSWLRK